jgi:hypothetical protein
MVVAEVFASQRWAAATVAVDEDVAAAIAFGWILCGLNGRVYDLVCHGVPLLYLSPKVFKRKGLPMDFEQTLFGFGLNAKARREAGLVGIAPLS